MVEERPVRAEYKRLKHLAKREPRLFARLASVEMEMGKLKPARKRLEQGIAAYPDYPTARALLADCLSRMGEHEASMREWENVIQTEPANQQARAGYVRELAYLEHYDSMGEALEKLYLLDPFNTDITSRYEETLLRRIRAKFPNIRVWNPQWHPGDFTPEGALARVVAYEMEIAPRREELPNGFEPSVDDAEVDTLLVKLPAPKSHPDVEDDLSRMLGEEEETTGATAGESHEEEVAAGSEQPSAPVAESGEKEAGESASLIDELPAPEEVDEERALESLFDDDAARLEIPDVDIDAEEARAAARERASLSEDQEEDEEDFLATSSDQAEEAPLIKALKAADVDPEGIIDIEGLVKSLDATERNLVEEPVIHNHAVPSEETAGKAETSKKEKEPEHKITQEDLDALFDPKRKKPKPGKEEGKIPFDQKDLDKILLAEKDAAQEEAESTSSKAPKSKGGVLNQDDLDALIASQKGGAGKKEPEEKKPQKEEPKKPAAPKSGGMLSQDDLDALIASQKAGAKKEEPAEEPVKEEKPEPKKAKESKGAMSQDDLDALLAAFKSKPAEELVDSEEPKAEEPPAPAPPSSGPKKPKFTSTPSLDDLKGKLDEAVSLTPKEETGDESAVTTPRTPVGGAESNSSQEAPGGFDIDRWFATRRQQEDEKGGEAKEEELPKAESPWETPAITRADREQQAESPDQAEETTFKTPPTDAVETPQSPAATSTDTEEAIPAEVEEPSPLDALENIDEFEVGEGPGAEVETEPAVDREEVKEEAPTPEPSETPETTGDKEEAAPEPEVEKNREAAAPAPAEVPTAEPKRRPAAPPPPPRPTPPPPTAAREKEEETPPEEFKGPVTKTFARLCIAQGKIEHAAEIIRRLRESKPDDPDVRALEYEIEQRMN